MLQGQIELCEERIGAELAKLAEDGAGEASPTASKVREHALRERLHRMLGVDLVAIPMSLAAKVRRTRPPRNGGRAP